MERLIVIENGEEMIFNMESRVVTIGRSSKNDISIKDRNASRRHCNIIKVGDSWFVVDCDSQNGTCVNQQSIKKHELEEGDKITVGAAEIIFMVAQETPYRTENSALISSPVEKKQAAIEVPKPSIDEPIAVSKPIDDSILEPKQTEKPAQLVQSSEEQSESNIEIVSEKIEDEPVSKIDESIASPKNEPVPKVDEPIASIPKTDESEPIKIPQESSLPQNMGMVREGRRAQGNQVAKHAQDFYKAFCEEFAKEIVGYEYVAKLIFISLITSENCLISGSPGIGKLSIVRTISQLLGLTFQRVSNLSIESFIEKSEKYNLESFFSNHINFVDHNGHMPLNVQNLVFDFLENQKIPGERKTTAFQQVNMLIGCDLPKKSDVSMVKYKDSFMFEIPLDFLPMAEEKSILERQLQTLNKARKSTSFTRYFSYFQMLLSNVKVNEKILDHIVNIVKDSNPVTSKSAKIKKYVSSGIGRRGGCTLLKAAQAHAVLRGEEEASMDDVKQIAYYTLAHRIEISEEAINENITKKQIIELLMGE